MKLCVSIKDNTFKNIYDKIKGEEFVEIRLDDVNLSDDEFNLLFSNKDKNLKTIATCRKGLYSDSERKEVLIKAISAGANFVDIEIESEVSFYRDIILLAKEKECKIIVS